MIYAYAFILLLIASRIWYDVWKIRMLYQTELERQKKVIEEYVRRPEQIRMKVNTGMSMEDAAKGLRNLSKALRPLSD